MQNKTIQGKKYPMMKNVVDTDKLEKIIKEKGYSKREAGLKSGSSESYVKSLVNRSSKGSSIDKFINLCDFLEIYPSEIVKTTWQKPTTESLNEPVMRNVLAACFKIYATYGERLSTQWLIDLIIMAYKKYSLDEQENKQPVNDNTEKIIYTYMEGKLENRN